jgi:hypothetical protein
MSAVVLEAAVICGRENDSYGPTGDIAHWNKFGEVQREPATKQRSPSSVLALPCQNYVTGERGVIPRHLLLPGCRDDVGAYAPHHRGNFEPRRGDVPE